MARYKCKICDCIYDESAGDPGNGVNAGTKFSDLPKDWTCPQCGAGKEFFEAI